VHYAVPTMQMISNGNGIELSMMVSFEHFDILNVSEVQAKYPLKRIPTLGPLLGYVEIFSSASAFSLPH
jgi:hypothetical protein